MSVAKIFLQIFSYYTPAAWYQKLQITIKHRGLHPLVVVSETGDISRLGLDKYFGMVVVKQ